MLATRVNKMALQGQLQAMTILLIDALITHTERRKKSLTPHSRFPPPSLLCRAFTASPSGTYVRRQKLAGDGYRAGCLYPAPARCVVSA